MNKLKILSIGVYVALCMCFASCGDGVCDEQEVDLGLPSGTIWAGWNVGASSPEEDGGYYGWGETEENCNSKINLNISNISGTQYDVARQKWGGSWRMPTIDEIRELVLECTWTWCQYKGVNGYKVTGPNGNNIFLLAAGERYGIKGCYGNYWSATLYEGLGGRSAKGLNFNNNGSYGSTEFLRGRLFSVRPVK